MTRRHPIALMLSLLLLVSGIATGLASCSEGQGAQTGQGEAPELPVRALSATDLSFDNSYPAVLSGTQDAEIRPKVSGFITKVHINEGDRVRAGQPLFQLDDVTYRAAVSQASASLSAAQAALSTAQLNYRNSQDLLAKNIISQSNFDEVSNALKSAEANVAVAQASLVSARENLSYCTVTSPITGVVGAVHYTAGNLVSPQSTLALAEVSNNSLVYAYFSLSERQLSSMTGGGYSEAELAKSLPELRLRLADGSIYPEPGKVKGISGVIDRTTGAISLRVDFPNPNGILRSGATGTILLPTISSGAIQVPQTATVEILNKKYVYVVGADNKVAFTEIEVSPVDDGQSYAVIKGLKTGDRIVLSGVTVLRDGAEIKPMDEEAYKQKQAAIQKQMIGSGAAR